jgi:hypothetical protein
VSQHGTYSKPNETTRSKASDPVSSCSYEQNKPCFVPADWHNTGTACSLDVLEKENAASGATDHGAILNATYEKSLSEPNPKPGFSAMSFAADPHRRVSRTLGYALTLDTPEGWAGLTFVLKARLSVTERARLASACIDALAPELAEAASGGAGMPGAPLFTHLDEAGLWSDLATREELKAYCLASFERLSPADQSAFLAHVQRRAA